MRVSHEEVVTHYGFTMGSEPFFPGIRSRSTISPLAICRSMISVTSASFPTQYHTPSGYITTLGPYSHWSRQPALLARTIPFNPRRSTSFLKKACNLTEPKAEQHPRGSPLGRSLMQTKICRENLLIFLEFS